MEKNEEQYGQIVVGSLNDMKIHVLLSRLFGLLGYFSNDTTKEIIHHIENFNPNAVIIEVFHSNFVNVNML
jgi:hypothetical protein